MVSKCRSSKHKSIDNSVFWIKEHLDDVFNIPLTEKYIVLYVIIYILKVTGRRIGLNAETVWNKDDLFI